MIQCFVRLSVVCNVCIVAKWCVLEQKLLLTVYRKSYEKLIATKINDLDLCLEVVKVMATIAKHSPLNISETIRDRGLVSNVDQ